MHWVKSVVGFQEGLCCPKIKTCLGENQKQMQVIISQWKIDVSLQEQTTPAEGSGSQRPGNAQLHRRKNFRHLSWIYSGLIVLMKSWCYSAQSITSFPTSYVRMLIQGSEQVRRDSLASRFRGLFTICFCPDIINCRYLSAVQGRKYTCIG